MFFRGEYLPFILLRLAVSTRASFDFYDIYEGWEQIDDRKWLQFHALRSPWGEAKAICASSGAIMVEDDSLATNRHLAEKGKRTLEVGHVLSQSSKKSLLRDHCSK